MRLSKLLPFLAAIVTASSSLAAENFQLRDGLPNFTKKLATQEPIRVSYFGGSITAGAGASDPKFCYRSLLSDWLKKQNPNATIQSYDAAIGGTGSWLGAFRCWNDVGYQRPDLVIVEFASSDDVNRLKSEALATTEGIVRQLRERTPSKPDILFVYAANGYQLSDPIQAKQFANMVNLHEKIAGHYGIPSVAMSQSASDQTAAGTLTAAEYSEDKFHPTTAAHAAFLEALKPFFEKVATTSSETKPLPKPLTLRPLQEAKLISYDWAELGDGWLGWQLSPSDKIPHVAVSNQPGATITLKFKGAEVGLYNIVNHESGTLEASIDGGAWQKKPAPDEGCATPMPPHPVAYSLFKNLDPNQEHILQVRIPETANPKTVRLGYFLVDGKVKDPNEGLDPLTRINKVYAEMKPLTWQPPANRWQHLDQTKAKLANGPALKIVMLGDSIIGDTSSSQFEFLLEKNYPKCKITKITSVRGSTGCWWYQDENRVEEYVFKHNPDLLIIGGISQRGDLAAIRNVIKQCRAKFPQLEVLLLSPTFGAPRDPHNSPDAAKEAYQVGLPKLAAEEKCGYFDMTNPWQDYIASSGYALDSFKRDVVHANDRGKQILGRLMEKFLAP